MFNSFLKSPGGSPGGTARGSPDDSPNGERMSYEDKKAEMENQKGDMSAENMAMLADEMNKQIKMEFKNAVANIKDSMTPKFLRKYFNKKIFTKEFQNLNDRIDNQLQTNKATAKADSKVAKKDKARSDQYKKMQEDRKYLIEVEEKDIEQAKNFEKTKQLEGFKSRRALIAAEAQAAVELQVRAKKEKEEQDVLDLRLYRQRHWSKVAKRSQIEANELKAHRDEEIKSEYQESLDRLEDEWEERNHARARLQVEGPGLSDPIGLPGAELGVFGVPMGAGAFNGNFEESGHQPGVDGGEVHLFTSFPYPAYETKSVEFMDESADFERNQALYDALQQDCKYLHDAVSRMRDMCDIASKDVHQLEQEQLELEKLQNGPPRRMPLPKEVLATNLRKERIHRLQRRIRDMEYAVGVALDKKMKNEAQMLPLAQRVAASKDKMKGIQGELDEQNFGQGMLPVVVGRNISKVPGMNAQTAQPRELLTAIQQQSKLIGYKELGKEAHRAHKDRTAMDQNLWIQRQQGSEVRLEAEAVLNRLAVIQGKLLERTSGMAKLNLYEALDAFLKAKIPLKKVVVKCAGIMKWWGSRHAQGSSNVEPFTSDQTMGGIQFEPYDPHSKQDDSYSHGVTLSEATSGFCSGVIVLPKLSMWSILIPLCRQKVSPDAATDGVGDDDTDFVTASLGTSFQTLKYVGTYFNKINPETGAILYDIKYSFRGDRLAYRFDFSSSSIVPAKHLAVGTGLFEEYEVAGLEIVSDPDEEGGMVRYLSSFVKMIRLEESAGKQRLSKLIEELVNVEDSTQTHWDSEIVNHTMQRYEHDYFLRILRAEILCEWQKDMLSYQSDPSLAYTSAQSAQELDGEPSKADKSKERFLRTKQQLQQGFIDAGKDIVGKRMEIFDDREQKWRHVLINDYRVRWKENGFKALVTHLVQEFDDFNDKIGTEIEIDLSKLRHFESAIQKIDEAAIARLKRMKENNRRLVEMNQNFDMAVAALKLEFDTYVHEQQRLFDKERLKIEKKMSVASLDRDAEKSLKTSSANKIIRTQIATTLLDMKRGLIKMQEGVKPREQAEEIARNNYLRQWKEEKQTELRGAVAQREQVIKDDVKVKLDEINRRQHDVAVSFRTEKVYLEWLIREAQKQENEYFMRKVAFNPDMFKLAVPTTTSCQHIKTKAWGNSYAKGLKCMGCQRELGDLHKEESQLLGYGTGCPPEFADAIKRHRENEQSFRFKSAEELQQVEEERRHLEKERREMDEAESYFYDFQDLKVLYEIDQRHARTIKDDGIFRQGLQWRPEEVELFEKKRVREEKVRMLREGILDIAIEQFDPLAMVQEPPPTFRASDERRKAQYCDLMFAMGRLQNFQKKITGLKEERLELMADRTMYFQILEWLHKESYQFNHTLAGIEQDIERTGQLLATYEKMKRLWMEAKRIMEDAIKDRKRCEMRHCGVWDDAQDAATRTDLLHEETRSLLKLKFLIDTKLEDTVNLLELRSAQLAKAEEEFARADYLASALLYCVPGDPVITRYGYGRIVVFRPADNTLLVTLPFGSPSAKLFVNAKEVVDAERARQRAEALLMCIEDEHMRRFVANESIVIKRELFLMANEEKGLKQFYEFCDLGANEDAQVSAAITEALKVADEISRDKAYKRSIKQDIDTKANAIADKRKREHDTYVGPPSGRPQLLTRWEIFQKKASLKRDLDQFFLKKFLRGAARSETARMRHVRDKWLINNSFDALIESTIGDMIVDVCREALVEGRNAKVAAERASGILFPNPVYMQHGTYELLAEIHKSRKEHLRVQIEVNRGLVSKSLAEGKEKEPQQLTPAEVRLKRIRRRLRRTELRRQEFMVSEMRAEEELTRFFCKWEMKENNRERRSMREADAEAKALVREEKRIAKAEAERLKAMMIQNEQREATEAELEARKKMREAITYEARRKELQALTMERRRRAEEEAFMTIEDKAGEALRIVDQKDRAKRRFAKEYGADAAAAAAAEDDAAQAQDEDDLLSPPIIPEWMKVLPLSWDDMDVVSQKKYVNFQSDLHARRVKIEAAAEREERTMDRLEDKALVVWEDYYRVFEYRSMELELERLVAAEEAKLCEANLLDLQENMRKIMVFCRTKGEEELHSRTDLRKKTELAKKRTQELKEAAEWLEVCERRARQRDKLKRRVTESCKFIDTTSVNGFHQRFATELLRKRLYEDYFREIVTSITNRAEIIATERRVMHIQECLSVNKLRLMERVTAMRAQWKDIQRDDLMRVRKSVLNQRFFPKHRHAVLKQRFGGWVRFFYWNRGHREAFQLKYEVLKRQIDIDRQFKAQLRAQEGDREAYDAQRMAAKAIPTIMSKHRERPIQCKSCNLMYLETQNHSMACVYHGGSYELGCPKTCLAPGLTLKCQSHRMKRWKCCDQTRSDALGCMRKYHSLQERDDVYERMLAKINERDDSLVKSLDERLAVLRKEDWPKQLFEMKRGQLQAVEGKLQAERDKAEKFHSLKWE